jgi:serine/threonine protein kinase
MTVGSKNPREIFLAAVKLPVNRRESYLAEACAGDEPLRQRVAELLKSHEEIGSFLDAPPAVTDVIDRSNPPSFSDGTQIGPYKLLQQIGEGGMGVVYMAEQQKPVRRRVALKIIKPGMDSRQVIARFEAERQALAMMDHPNIARVLDAGCTESGRPYFAMELVQGIPITQYCDDKQLPPEERLELFIEVCHAVQHAHQKGIIHRDLKPSNVLVTIFDGKPIPKIIDFGVAKALHQQLTEKTMFTQFGAIVGTLEYMSPEQAQSDAMGTDTRSDIYSLGVLLYELLTGTTPMDGKKLRSLGYAEMLKAIREVDPPKPSTRLSQSAHDLAAISAKRHTEPRRLQKLIAGDLDWIVMKCLEKDRTRRYDTATGLALDIQRHLQDEAVSASPPGQLYKLQKLVRRNKLVCTAAACVMLALLLGMAGSLWQAVLATRAQHAEMIARQESEANEQKAVAARDDADKASQQALQEAARAERASQDALQSAARAEQARQKSLHAAAQAEARYFIQSDEETPALARATEAYKIGGAFEDGLLLDECVKGSRGHWALAAEIKPQGDSVPLCATFASADGKDVLIAASGNRIDEYDVHTGQLLASAPTRDTAVRLVAPRIPGEGKVIAQSTNSIMSFELPGLKPLAERNFAEGISEISAAENQLAVLERRGMLRIVDFEKLEDVASKDFSQALPGGDLPIHCAIAPDGSTVAMPGRNWWKPGVVWRVSSGELTQVKLRTSRPLVFADNETIVSWYTPSQNGQLNDGLVFTNTNSSPPQAREYRISGIDTKDTLETQAWTVGKVVNVGLRGQIGTLSWNNSGYETDRYANLWPFEQERVEGLCAMYPKGLLALVQGSKILIFDRAKAVELGRGNFSTALANSGLVDIGSGFQLIHYPYDLRQKSQRTQLVNPFGKDWFPWALAISADESTIVLLVQQSDNFVVAGQFGATRAIVFRPGNWKNAEKPEAWKVQAAFEVDMPPPISPWDMRMLGISADGSTFAYATQGGVVRYSATGQKFGRLTGWGPTVCSASDGTLLASTLTDGRIQWLDVATGKTNEIQPNSQPKLMCFVRDNSGIVAGDSKSLTRYDLKTGDIKWSKPSKLLPLAWPAQGDRFVALKLDEAENVEKTYNNALHDVALNGSLVLAKTDTSEIVSIVAKYGSYVSLAYFSPSENDIFLREGRWQTKILRSLNPEEATDLLRRLTTTGSVVAAPQPLPEVVAISAKSQNDSAVLDAADKNLAQHLQEDVTIAGRVARLSWTATHNAVNIEFEGPESSSLMIWVPPTMLPKLKESLGEDFEQKLTGAKVQMRGRLLKYGGAKSDWKNRLQMTFGNTADIKILSGDGNNSAALLLAADPASEEPAPQQPKPSVAAAPTPASVNPAATALDAASEQLPEHVEENVVVRGHVKLVSWTAAHTGFNIEFDGPEKSSLLVWVSPKSLPMLKESLGDDFEQKLKDAKLEIRGKLLKYGGSNAAWANRLQISFQNKDQIRILPADDKN